jgi:hypothetical protein
MPFLTNGCLVNASFHTRVTAYKIMMIELTLRCDQMNIHTCGAVGLMFMSSVTSVFSMFADDDTARWV